MGGWTTYGEQQIFAVGIGAIDQPVLYLALFQASADPSGSPVELTLAGYSRHRVDFDLASTDHGTSHADINVGPLAAGSYLGVQILDDPVAGQPWFWDDESAAVTIGAGTVVPFLAGSITVVRTP